MEEEEIILIPKLRAAALCASALKELTAKAAKYAHLKGSWSPPGEQNIRYWATARPERTVGRRPTDNNECSV